MMFILNNLFFALFLPYIQSTVCFCTTLNSSESDRAAVTKRPSSYGGNTSLLRFVSRLFYLSFTFLHEAAGNNWKSSIVILHVAYFCTNFSSHRDSIHY